MGNNSRKKYSADFKAKVALEALKEQMTLPELEKKFGVSQYMISRWKRELSKNASQTFGTSGNEESHQKEVDTYYESQPACVSVSSNNIGIVTLNDDYGKVWRDKI